MSHLVKLFCLSLCFACIPVAQNANAEQLTRFGLTTLRPMSDQDGDSVRGLGLLARHQGFSLISGTLLDPATGSTLTERAVQYTQVMSDAAEGCCGMPSIASVEAITTRDIALSEELTIQGMTWFMNGSILSDGLAYAERF